MDGVLKTARAALALGISVVPPCEDGTKAPDGQWKRYQKARASESDLATWYGKRTGLGFVTGGISGGLELFEFDDAEAYRQFKEAAVGLGYGELIERIEGGYLEETPGGGFHWFYYTDEVRGNSKLARRYKHSDEFTEDDIRAVAIAQEKGRQLRPVKSMIETRGEGGFAVVAPTYGLVHPTGRPYRQLAGDVGAIVRISGAEREWLWELARSLDELEEPPPAESVPPRADRSADWPDTVTPWDDYNVRTTWADVLVGWTMVYRHGETEYWRRPGRSDGCSATVNRNGSDRLYVFSTSTEFETEKPYTKFAALARMEYRGDLKAAAKALAEQGYGTHKRWVQTPEGWTLRVFGNPIPKGERIARPGDRPPARPFQEKNGRMVPEENLCDASETIGRSGQQYPFALIVKGEGIKEKQVDWLIKDRIAYGFLNLFAGRTKIGKSFCTLDIAARLSVGGEIPLGDGECFSVQDSLIISEDSPEYVIVPRLVAAGADMGRFCFMTWQAMSAFTLSDTTMLDDTYHAAGSPRMVVIDPPTNFLGGRDEHKNAEIRAVLMRVGVWAMRHQVAIVLITHCNKGTKKDMVAIDRIIGSIAWAATTRIAHIFGPHPDNPGEFVFLPVGSNLGEPADGLSYQIVKGDDGRGRVNWLGTVDISADDVMSGTMAKKPRGIQAVEWLIEQFGKQREWPSDELMRNGKEAGLSRNAFWAPEVGALPIRKRQIVSADGNRHWVWQAEDGWPVPAERQAPGF